MKTKCEITVPFFDLDPMNVVYHGNYVKYFEVARCDFFKKAGYTYENMKAAGISFPIVKLDVKYIKPARFNQELIVETELLEIEPAMIFKYTIFDKITGEKICRAKTMQMGTSNHSGETVLNLPYDMKKCLERFL